MCSPRVYWLLFEVCSPEASRAISSYSKTWPFHVDDWFRYSEEGEEGSGFGLCPLIILYYHTGGIYHQTPKASVHGEHWNQSHRLHAIHLGPQKTAMLSATTFTFSVRGERYSKEKARNLKKKLKKTLKKSRAFERLWNFFLKNLCGVVVTAGCASINLGPWVFWVELQLLHR